MTPLGRRLHMLFEYAVNENEIRKNSDERFAANYVHHHARPSQGPGHIRAALRPQGAADSQIEQEVAAAGQDRAALAAEVRARPSRSPRKISRAPVAMGPAEKLYVAAPLRL